MTNPNHILTRKQPRDEFYTQWNYIDAEVQYYTKHLEGRRLYLNCDDPDRSNFWRYFKDTFHNYKLGELVATWHNAEEHYLSRAGLPRAKEFHYDGRTTTWNYIEGDGRFQSGASMEVGKRADVIITNPPFSRLVEHYRCARACGARFLILANLSTVVSAMDIMKAIVGGDVWFGTSANTASMNMWFDCPSDYPRARAKPCGGHEVRVSPIVWLTNMDHGIERVQLPVRAKYNPAIHRRYDQYNAINCNRLMDIPRSWTGEMGVPVTILPVMNPKQFTLTGWDKGKGFDNFTIDGKNVYTRVLIKHTRPELYA